VRLVNLNLPQFLNNQTQAVRVNHKMECLRTQMAQDTEHALELTSLDGHNQQPPIMERHRERREIMEVQHRIIRRCLPGQPIMIAALAIQKR
jgi:hypothetical protein